MDIVISINKPKDISSQDAVTQVKRILRIKKAGHTGTLDPMATGLLLVCVNRATRLASYFTVLDKQYRAVMKLGERTDTQDAYGKIIETCDDINIDSAEIEDTLRSFEGRILQKPPMFSALKYQGTPLYKMARQGIEIERTPREVTIHKIDLSGIDLPYVTFHVTCSKGTYIRTLCDDIGNKIGVGAHLAELERTSIGSFNIKDSLTFEELTAVSEGENITNGIYTVDEAMDWLPEFKIRESSLKSVIHGNPIRLNTFEPSDALKTAKGIRIKSPDGYVLAIGSYSAVKNEIKMDMVFA